MVEFEGDSDTGATDGVWLDLTGSNRLMITFKSLLLTLSRSASRRLSSSGFRDNAISALKASPEIAEEIMKQLR